MISSFTMLLHSYTTVNSFQLFLKSFSFPPNQWNKNKEENQEESDMSPLFHMFQNNSFFGDLGYLMVPSVGTAEYCSLLLCPVEKKCRQL